MKIMSVSRRRWVQVGLVHGAVGECASLDFPGIYVRLEDKEVLDFIKLVAFGIRSKPLIRATSTTRRTTTRATSPTTTKKFKIDRKYVENFINKIVNISIDMAAQFMSRYGQNQGQ